MFRDFIGIHLSFLNFMRFGAILAIFLYFTIRIYLETNHLVGMKAIYFRTFKNIYYIFMHKFLNNFAFRESLSISFTRIMTDDAVSTWALDTHKGIKKNTELLIMLICAKLDVSFFLFFLSF